MTPASAVRVAADEAAMVEFGAQLGAVCEPGLVIFLQGDLGMGKTTFSRGFMHSLGHQGAVKSPTYTLVEPYRLRDMDVYHFDLYRLGDPEELEFMGIRDYFGDMSVCLVEWPERGVGALPLADLRINIAAEGRGRRLQYTAQTEQGRRVLAQMQAVSGAQTQA
ncbi:MAG: tRNA (adenosine(37)-N6)-threonylcarbamoyltransferase complex ATPase subunit type 1 TsaE [Halioglobus sp.]|nr:tRNA (adenosine(37)-N6)-threonylcarbamoyltransferase complex ATPase subunit type 1 TsaE [Halioglobus sp.]